MGCTERAAKEAGIKYKVGKFPYMASGKARAIGEIEGFVKLILGEPHGEILGAHIIGAEATELIAELGLAINLEATVRRDRGHHPRPSHAHRDGPRSRRPGARAGDPHLGASPLAAAGGASVKSRAMPPPAISIRNLTKVYPIPFKREKITAVRDLSLEVEAGQVYGLLGPNGSGKSTTMKIVLGPGDRRPGARRGSSGATAARWESREQVGFLPENPYFYKFLTGAETLRFYGKLCGLRGAALQRRAAELLDLVGLSNAADRRLGGYSKGMLQRIGLAQALVQEPRLLVLDEPTAGVDPAGSREIRDLILKFKSAASPCCSARICSRRCRRSATASASCMTGCWCAKAGSTSSSPWKTRPS